MMMMIMIMMKKYKANECHTFVTRMRCRKIDEVDNDDDEEIQNEEVSHGCDIYAFYKK